MLSLPMNEFMQQSLAAVNINVEFEVVELENLYNHWRNGAAGPLNAGTGITAINLGYVTADPFYALTRFAYSKYIAPNGVNWGGLADPKIDKLVETAQTSFDLKVQDKALADIHQSMVDDALMLWVVHDTNPRALAGLLRRLRTEVPKLPGPAASLLADWPAQGTGIALEALDGLDDEAIGARVQALAGQWEARALALAEAIGHRHFALAEGAAQVQQA
jgi:ABC-type transport system substrate-binding protein